MSSQLSDITRKISKWEEEFSPSHNKARSSNDGVRLLAEWELGGERFHVEVRFRSLAAAGEQLRAFDTIDLTLV